MQREHDTPRYDQLIDAYRPIVHLDGVGNLLSWDQQVMMPAGGTPARARQQATVSRLRHERLADPTVGDYLRELGDAELTEIERAAVREIKRQHERAVRVPTELIEELRQLTAEALPVWEEARETNDSTGFVPMLEDVIELKREYAAHIDPDRDPYEILFEDYEPYLSLDTADAVLAELRDALVPILEGIAESEVTISGEPLQGEFPIDQQRSCVEDVLDVLGYDWEHGRIDTSTHPFTSGNPFDSRVTTRFDPTDLRPGLGATIHEFGHADYELGLPRDAYGTPLGESRDLTVHESQSRLWENHVGRSRPFWTFLLPRLAETFPSLADVSPDAAFAAVNKVYPDNLIRVEADELTYHLHIIVRYEIEREVMAGSLDVAEIPAVWNDRYESYLGVRPETETDGWLQDIHWSSGYFGYFPTYSLGSVLAAQLYGAIERDIGSLDEQLTTGSVGVIQDWLREAVHHHGCRYPTPELIETATGESFGADAFIAYVSEKYGELYDL